MSLEAMVWALKHAPIPGDDPLTQLVLIGLADHAADDGTGARPSVATLAKYARCSTRSVHNKLRDLQAEGLIGRGDQQAVAHLPANRRPVVYDLVLPGVHQVHTRERSGVNEEAGRGERPGSSGVNAVADRTVLEPSKEPTPHSPPEGGKSESDPQPVPDVTLVPGPYDLDMKAHEAAFALFWQVYPRKAGKGAALRAWLKAVRSGVPASVIVAGADRYRQDPNRVAAYTSEPARWLRAGRWEDDPLPDRPGGDSPTDEAARLRAERLANRTPPPPPEPLSVQAQLTFNRAWLTAIGDGDGEDQAIDRAARAAGINERVTDG